MSKTSLMLLKHFGLDEELIKPQYLKYPEIEDKFKKDDLDAAFITMGINEPVFRRAFETGKCDLLSIPYRVSLTKKHLSMSTCEIPQGHYCSQPSARPATEIKTVAVNALLLTRSDVHTGLVEEVTRLVLSEDFLKKHKLRELFDDKGHDFAREKTEFPIHDGAQNFYEPELKPLLPSEFVGSIEQIRRWAVSFLIAVFFAVRRRRQRKLKKRDHKLDRFIRKLLDIEQEEVALGTSGRADDVERLQKLAADVTSLRQDALREFSARELTEDRAPQYFIDMAHDLSSKIDTKISRQRLDKGFDQLAEAIGERGYASDKPQTMITCQVKAETVWGQNVHLVGDHPLLGEWAPEAGIKLSPKNYPTWSVTVSLPAPTAFQYKFVKQREGDSPQWETGDNRELSTPNGGSVSRDETFRE